MHTTIMLPRTVRVHVSPYHVPMDKAIRYMCHESRMDIYVAKVGW